MSKFNIGDKVINSDTQERGYIVEVYPPRRGRQLYKVKYDGRVNDESSAVLLPDVDLTDPFERCRQIIYGNYSEYLKGNTAFKIKSSNNNTISSLKASRTLFRPYQFKPLLKFLNSGNKRILIADEVGLGKTIEAGHIMMELKARGVFHNALVICPMSLRAKWTTELNEKFSNDADKYELVSDEEKNTWHHVQLTKMVWKVDVILNKKNSSTGTSNEHKWIDLGLPSGTKWSTCNIGAETPNATGSLFAWAETKPKRKYTIDNYSIDRELLVIDNAHDAAKLLNGDSWTVPSCENWRELFLYCNIEYDAFKNAIIVTSPNKQQLVFPFVQNSEKDGVIYWTNTCIAGLHDPKEGSAAAFILERLPDWGIIYADKWRGCPIRPVYKK